MHTDVHVVVGADGVMTISGPEVDLDTTAVAEEAAEQMLRATADRLGRSIVVVTTDGARRFRDVITPEHLMAATSQGPDTIVLPSAPGDSPQADEQHMSGPGTDGDRDSVRRPRRNRRGRHVRKGLLAVVGVTAVCLGTMAVVLSGTDEGAPQPPIIDADADVFASGIAPPGWSQRVAWSFEIDPDVAPTVTPSGLLVVTSPSGDVTIVDPAAGSVVWSGGAGIASPPIPAATVGDEDVVAWHTGDDVRLWRSASGELTTINDDADHLLSAAGDSLMLTDRDGSDPRVLTPRGWTSVAVPSGAVAMGATANQVIPATGRLPLWRSPVPGGDPIAATLEHDPDLVLRRWVGLAGNTVTVVWDDPGTPDPDRSVQVAVHSVTTGDMLASAPVMWHRVQDADFTAAAGESPATVAVGPVVLPLTGDREATVADDVTWGHHAYERAYGATSTDRPVGFYRDGVVKHLPTGSYVPLGIGRADTAIVQDGTTLLGLEPE